MATRNTVSAKSGTKSPMPASVSPMLCTLTREVVQSEQFLYEIKWDGYRIISYVQKGQVRMDSRSALDYTKKYPPVAQALKELKHDAVLDGEVVVFNAEGLRTSMRCSSITAMHTRSDIASLIFCGSTEII